MFGVLGTNGSTRFIANTEVIAALFTPFGRGDMTRDSASLVRAPYSLYRRSHVFLIRRPSHLEKKLRTLSSADGTAWATMWESRSPPISYIQPSSGVLPGEGFLFGVLGTNGSTRFIANTEVIAALFTPFGRGDMTRDSASLVRAPYSLYCRSHVFLIRRPSHLEKKLRTLSSADGTAWATMWESRSPPISYIQPSSGVLPGEGFLFGVLGTNGSTRFIANTEVIAALFTPFGRGDMTCDSASLVRAPYTCIAGSHVFLIRRPSHLEKKLRTLSSADGTAWATMWESRSPPISYI